MSLSAAVIRLRPRSTLILRNGLRIRGNGRILTPYPEQVAFNVERFSRIATFSSHITGARPYRDRGLRISRSKQNLVLQQPEVDFNDHQNDIRAANVSMQNQDQSPSLDSIKSPANQEPQQTNTNQIPPSQTTTTQSQPIKEENQKELQSDSKNLPVLSHPTTPVPLAPEGQRGILDRNTNLRQSVESILGQPTLVVTREVEMMNIFLGYEQANKYSILTPEGYQLGYLVESQKGLLGGALKRQFLRTHRSFEAHVLDPNGQVVLKIKRPTTLINSKLKVLIPDPSTGQERLIGEVHQNWHLYRRRYDLFINQGEQIDESDSSDSMVQFATIDGGLFAWEFLMVDENDRPLGAISRNFRGIGREIFTDTGQYVLTFDPTQNENFQIEAPKEADGSSKSEKERNPLSNSSTGRELIESGPSRPLTMDERAIALATAISADFDYFSRHSQSSSHSMFPFVWMGGGSSGGGTAEVPAETPTPNQDGSNTPAPSRQDSSDIRAPPPTPGSDGGAGAAAGTGAGYDILTGGGQQNNQPDFPNNQTGMEGGAPPSNNEQPWWDQQNDSNSGQEDVWNNEDPWKSDGDDIGGGGGDSWGWTDWLPGGGDG